MRARPISITIVAWLFIVVGCVGLVAGALPLFHGSSAPGIAELDTREVRDLAFATTSRLLCILGGTFLLFGRNWARWLLVAWMGFHIVLSSQHSLSKLLVHCVLFSPVLYLLFRPPASAYFSGRGSGGGEDLEARGSK